MLVEVRIPEISENVTSGKVVRVLVQEGDMIDIDDILIEFETEKALVEIPSTAKGRIVALLAKEGQTMRVGDLIARIESQAREAPSKDAPIPMDPPADPASGAARAAKEADNLKAPEREAVAEAPPGPPPPEVRSDEEVPADRHALLTPAAPSVRRFARELGVAIQQVQGSGPGGRITEADIKAFVRQGRGASLQEADSGVPGEPALPDFSHWGEVTATEWTAVRRLTARSTATSWRVVPHVTQFDRADITQVEAFIRNNAPKMQQQGIKLSLTAIVMKVCALALVQFPRFNASVDPAHNRIIFKKYVHIGLAVDTERGLLVPVVRNADRKNIGELAAAIADLATRARNKKIKPDEMEGGSFTLSNQGGIGGTQFTPIVMWPQVAILGMSSARIEPVYTDGAFVPRSILPLALSYDHRIIDGADAARFLRWVCEGLEMPLTLHLT
jgi:pyruvate dehydrogenase E2 component (dihydrolipoamide acetyltransferase)